MVAPVSYKRLTPNSGLDPSRNQRASGGERAGPARVSPARFRPGGGFPQRQPPEAWPSPARLSPEPARVALIGNFTGFLILGSEHDELLGDLHSGQGQATAGELKREGGASVHGSGRGDELHA